MKRFLALLLALVMIFGLAACGEKPNDNDSDKKDPNKNDPSAISDVLMGVSVADVDALISIFTGADAGLDIEDLYFELGASDKGALLGLGAKLLGEQHDIDLHMGEAFVLSAPSLLDKNYGITMDGLTAMLESMMGATAPGMGDTAMGGNSVVGMLSTMDPEAVADLLVKYYDLLIAEIKKAEGITATTQDGNTVLNGTMTPAGAATVVVNLLEALCADDDFFALLGTVMGTTADEAKQNFLSGKPDAATLTSQLTNMLTTYELKIKLTDLKLTAENAPVAGMLHVYLDQEVETDEVRPAEIYVAFDFEKGFFNATIKDEGTELAGMDIGDGKLEIRFNIDGASGKLSLAATDSSLKGSLVMNGETLGELDFTFSDTELNFKVVVLRSEYVINIKIDGSNVTGTLKMDGQEMGKLTFSKKESGSKTTLTVKTLTINATEVDFSSAGISFYIDTDANIPAAPSSYTDISKMTEDDLQAVLEKFMTDNADLVEWLQGIAPGPEEDMMAG